MLGVEIKHDQEAKIVHLSQCAYIDSILRRYNLDKLKLLSIPMDPFICLTSNQSPMTIAEHTIMCNKPYCKAVGALNWAALIMQSDIAFAVTTIAQFAMNPGVTH